MFEDGQGSQETAPEGTAAEPTQSAPPGQADSGQQGQPTPGGPPTGGSSPYAQYLQQIEDENARQVAEQAFKQWDAGVTRKFQEIHSQYAPFRSFAEQGIDAEQLSNAVQLYQLIDTNPQYLYQLLKTELEGTGEQGPPGVGVQGQQEGQLPPEIQAVIQPLQMKLEQQNQLLEAMAGTLVQQQSERQQAEEDQVLEGYLNNLKTEFGNFDERYVLSLMAQGLDGAQAVQHWQSQIQGWSAQQDMNGQGAGSRAPRVLSGSGVLPLQGTDVKKASSEDITDLTSKLLAQANSQKT